MISGGYTRKLGKEQNLWKTATTDDFHNSTVAQQDFHSCGVSQGSCSAGSTIPNLEKICTMGKICLVGAIQWCFNWQDPKTQSKTSKLQDESCFNSLRNHSSTDCWLCLGNQSANTIQCIHWLKRNALIPGETFVINITHKLI